VFGLYASGFVGPPVPTAETFAGRRGTVFSYRGSLLFAARRLIRSAPLPPSRVAQPASAKALLELLLIYPHGSGDADYAIRRYLALPNPEVDRIGGDPESIGNFAYFCKSGRHRHCLVISSNHGCIERPSSLISHQFVSLRITSRRFALFFWREVFQERIHSDSPVHALAFGLETALSRSVFNSAP
jgi:hypothetical protein